MKITKDMLPEGKTFEQLLNNIGNNGNTVINKWGRKVAVTLMILLWVFFLHRLSAKAYTDVDDAIIKGCRQHPMAMETVFGDQLSHLRCQSIMRLHREFENVNPVYGNIGGYKRNGAIIRFRTLEDGVRFGVNRYYRYERYKTLHNIMYGGCYYSPAKKGKSCGIPYSYTDQDVYYQFMKMKFKGYYNLKKYNNDKFREILKDLDDKLSSNK